MEYAVADARRPKRQISEVSDDQALGSEPSVGAVHGWGSPLVLAAEARACKPFCMRCYGHDPTKDQALHQLNESLTTLHSQAEHNGESVAPASRPLNPGHEKEFP